MSQEKRIAKSIGGVVTVNSGGTKFGGGDVLTDLFLIEAKTSTKNQQSITIKKDWLLKAKEQAFEQNKDYYSVAVSFGDEEDYYIIDDRLFKTLLVYLEGDVY